VYHLCQLLQTEPRDAVRHTRSIVHKAGRAQCDKLTTIVGRLLTTLDNTGSTWTAKFLQVSILRQSSRRKYPYFGDTLICLLIHEG